MLGVKGRKHPERSDELAQVVIGSSLSAVEGCELTLASLSSPETMFSPNHFMNCIKIATNQRFFLGARPTFQLSF
jgi:hypothetical protein